MKLGSLFSGYGGLDLAVESVFDATTAWVADIDPGPRKILAHRFPHAPNLGDVTAVDWAAVEPVDIIAGGSPCQDVSHAGRRAGMTTGTRSNLWSAMREAIATIRPSLVVWENVRGVMSAAADSAMEPCPGCMGNRNERPVLRAFGRVLGDLASIGYDAQWHGIRAADVGACHGRWRVFVIAYPQGDPWRIKHRNSRDPVTDPVSGGRDGRAPDPLRGALGGTTSSGSGEDAGRRLTLLPTPTATPYGNNQSPSPGAAVRPSLDSLAKLLPTPRSSDTNGGGAHGEGGLDLRTTVALLPTPMVGSTSPAAHGQISGQRREQMANALGRWGDYAAAIHRHESMLGGPAPSLTEPGRTGNPRLSARFAEWMMCLPDGWVTDTPSITRNEARKALGNGVVPLQAETALRHMIAHLTRQDKAA